MSLFGKKKEEKIRAAAFVGMQYGGCKARNSKAQNKRKNLASAVQNQQLEAKLEPKLRRYAIHHITDFADCAYGVMSTPCSV